MVTSHWALHRKVSARLSTGSALAERMGQGEVGGANYAAKLTFIFATDSSVFIMATVKSCGVLAVHKSTLITNTGIIQNK